MDIVKNKKVLQTFLILVALILLAILLYYQNYLKQNGIIEQNQLTSINFAEGKVYLIKDKQNLQAVYYKKTLLGWNKELVSAPIIMRGNPEKYSLDFIEFFSIDNHTLYFGYVPNKNINEIRLQTFANKAFPHSLDIRYKVNSNYWLIPIDSKIGDYDFELSVISKEGKEYQIQYDK